MCFFKMELLYSYLQLFSEETSVDESGLFNAGVANQWHACYKWNRQPLCVASDRVGRKKATQWQIYQEAEDRAADWAQEGIIRCLYM